jgi:alpha-beta hydrolase superfamily lysophospholipase
MEFNEDSGDFAAGGVRLHRASVQPRQSPWARLIIFHGYGDHGGRYLHLMRWLATRGVACHAFDSRGHGRSSGRRAFIGNWDEFLTDAATALEHEAGSDASCAPRFLLGHSHGGLVVAAGVIRKRLSADGIILCSPYLHSGVPVTRGRLAMARAVGLLVPWARFATRLPPSWISSDAEMMEESRQDPLLLRAATPRWYVRMLTAQEQTRARAAEFTLPLLCLAGDADQISLPSATVQFYESAGSCEKCLRRYPGMVHELLRDKGRARVFEDIRAWLRGRTNQPGGTMAGSLPASS